MRRRPWPGLPGGERQGRILARLSFFPLLLMGFIYVDIETGPLPDEILQYIKPNFRATRAKKPDKVAEEIAEKEAEWFEKAALSALTGKVLMIGVRLSNNKGQMTTKILASGDEKADLEIWWSLWKGAERMSQSGFPLPLSARMGDKIVGLNVTKFDLLFLRQRAMIHGVSVPWQFGNLDQMEKREGSIIDVGWEWNGKIWGAKPVSLRSLALAFGLEPKDEYNSEHFHKLWEKDRQAAMAHCEKDLELTEAIYNRMLATTYRE